MNLNQSLNRYKTEIISILLIVIMSIYPVFLRITGSDVMGINGSDSFWYWDTAYKWLNGNFHVERHYRPLAHILNAFGLKAFGINDYSLKYVSAILDVINIGTVYFLGRTILKYNISAVLLSIMYAFCGQAIGMSHHELVHIGTMTFLLPSVLFFIKYLDFFHSDSKKPKIYLFLSGLFIGLSGHMHPEIFAQLGIYTLFVLYKNQILIKRELDKKMIIHLAYLYSGFLFVFVFFVKLIGLFDIIEKISSGASFQHGTRAPRSLLDKTLRVLSGQYIYLKGIVGTIPTYVIYLVTTYFCYDIWKQRVKHNKKIYLILIMFLSQLTLCLVLISRNLLPRILYPFMPLILIFVMYNIERFKGWRNNIKYKTVLISFFAVTFILSNGLVASTKIHHSHIKKYSEIIKKDGRSGKVMIGPMLFYNIGEGFKFRLYLGKRTEYLYHKFKYSYSYKSSLQDYLKDNGFSYILLGKTHLDKRMIKDPVKIKKTKKVVNNFFKVDYSKYNEEFESNFWKNLKEDMNLIKIYEDNGAVIYGIR